MTITQPPRTRAILDATLRLVGQGGPRAVTHRAVATEAGVSLGAITHHFPSRERLLESALRQLADLETQRLERLTLDLQDQAFDLDAWITTISAVLAADIRADPARQLTTYELLLDCARNEAMRDVMSGWTQAQLRLCLLGLRAAGSAQPELHAQIVIAAITGLLLKQLAYPREDFEKGVLRPALAELIGALTGTSLPRGSANHIGRQGP